MSAHRFRWWLWRHVIKLPGVCPANAHSRIVWRYRERSPRIDSLCRSDAERCGVCWCGQLKSERAESADA